MNNLIYKAVCANCDEELEICKVVSDEDRTYVSTQIYPCKGCLERRINSVIERAMNIEKGSRKND